MKIIGSVKEDLSIEKRISITPDIIKKFSTIGFSINLERKYAEHLNLNDNEYKKNGANINLSKEEVFKKSDIILKVNAPTVDEINLIKNKTILIGQFDLSFNKDMVDKLIEKDVKIFSLNLLPRITRA